VSSAHAVMTITRLNANKNTLKIRSPAYTRLESFVTLKEYVRALRPKKKMEQHYQR